MAVPRFKTNGLLATLFARWPGEVRACLQVTNSLVYSRTSSAIEVAMNDLRSAVRSLRATPLVAGVAALSLTLGIGASIVIFSLTNSLLPRKLPVRDPSALVLVTDATVPGVRAYALGVWESFRRFVDVFDGSLAWSPTEFNLVPRGEAQIASGAWVSGSYFETLG